MVKYTVSTAFFIFFSSLSLVFGQGLNNNWITGYQSQYGYPSFGESTINFQSGFPTISFTPMEMDFRQTHSNISDINGNILFYTNGYYISDASQDTMINDTGINPSSYTSGNSGGLYIPQSALIIPFPDSSNKYILFHSTIDNPPDATADYLYYSIIDMSLNGGLGAMTLKNQIIISDELNAGKISAVKHGNGRDWWIICHKVNSNSFYKILVTPSGIENPILQSIGIFRPRDVGQAIFSPDGTKYAYHWFEDGLEIFDFDRCSGTFSNSTHILVSNNSGSGVAFSPNSEVLYASATDSLVQFDLVAANIVASKMIVGVWDSFYSGTAQLPSWFELMGLAPDGKIYITTGNGTFHYHIIDQADSLGTACNVIQHGLNLNHYYFNTLPNHPNYHLGPMLGSICDSITGIPPPQEKLTLKLYPNPNNGLFQITYTPVPENLHLQVFNILGEEVYAQLLPQWSQLQNIQIGNLPAGIYMATITSSANKKSVKFVVE